MFAADTRLTLTDICSEKLIMSDLEVKKKRCVGRKTIPGREDDSTHTGMVCWFDETIDVPYKIKN